LDLTYDEALSNVAFTFNSRPYMKAFGKVEVPQEAFMAVLKIDQNVNN
jgi:translation elongation factor EF-4